MPGSSRSQEKTPGCVHRARLSMWRGAPSWITSSRSMIAVGRADLANPMMPLDRLGRLTAELLELAAETGPTLILRRKRAQAPTRTQGAQR